MKYDRLYNFISPVTGKLPIDKGYILLGDKHGRSFSSPVLIDVRQDIIDLRKQIGNFQELKKLNHNRIWIGDYYNEPQESLTIGVINLPPLAEALFPNPISGLTGDFRIPNPTFDYLSPFDWVMSGPFLPQIYATKYDTLGNPIGTDISSSLAMTQVRAAQIMKRFDNANFIVGSSTVEFTWENPKMYLIPESLKQLYGLGTTYTFSKAQSLGNLQTGLLKNTVSNATGTLSTAIAGKDYVDVANPIPNMLIAVIQPENIVDGHDIGKLISRSSLSDANIAPKDKEYILQNKSGNDLPNSIGLNNFFEFTDVNDKLLKIKKHTHLDLSWTAELTSAVPNDDYITPSKLTTEIAIVQAEIESQIATLTGYATLTLLAEFLANLGFTAGYGEYLFYKYKPLHTENHYGDTDNYDKQGGNIWFDASHIGNAGDFRPGLRVTSWDSSTTFTNDLFPVSIGLFGYMNKLGYVPVQAGFVWQSYMEQDSSNPHYRFPVNFGLYYVGHDKGQIGWNRGETLLMEYNYYDAKFYFKKQVKFDEEVIINADIHLYKDVVFYEKFYVMGAAYFGGKIVLQTPYPTISFLNDTIIEDLINISKSTTGTVKINFHKDIYCETKGAIKIPVGNSAERPSNSEVGMLRYNIEI